MTEEEKKAAEEKAAAEAAAAAAVSNQNLESDDPIAAKDIEIAKLIEERDNYKAVALKRKGKLAEDDQFFAKEGLDEFIEDKVLTVLADKELARREVERDNEIKRITKENSELRLALKNRPGTSSGGDSGATVQVKDSVFSDEQLAVLKEKAIRLKADPDKFIEAAKRNFLNNH